MRLLYLPSFGLAASVASHAQSWNSARSACIVVGIAISILGQGCAQAGDGSTSSVQASGTTPATSPNPSVNMSGVSGAYLSPMTPPSASDLVNIAVAKCEAALNVGDMASFAGSGWSGSAPWPQVNSGCLQAISVCLSSSSCLSGDSKVTNIRDTYPLIISKPAVEFYAAQLNNDLLMQKLQQQAAQLCTKSNFEDTLFTLSEELAMLSLVSQWYDTYAAMIISIDNLMVDAFMSILPIMEMPATQMVKGTKRHWWKVALKLLNMATAAVGLYTAGAGVANLGLDKDHKIETSSISAYKTAVTTTQKQLENTANCVNINREPGSCAYNPIGTTGNDTSSGLESQSDGVQTDDDVSMEFTEVIGVLKMFLHNFLKTATVQQEAIATNSGRLKAAAAIANACSISSIEMQSAVTSSFGAMQWMALGILMPQKYAIYWQRDYGGASPSCYYNSGNACYGSQSSWGDNGCWQVPPWIYDQAATVNQGGTFGNSSAPCSANRYVWISQIGSSTPASQPPSTEFFQALASKDGPLNTYVNPVFGKNFSGTAGAWEAFVSQCQCMPKVISPNVVTTSSDNSNSNPTPSSVPVHCEIFGISLPTYAFEDCGTTGCVFGRSALTPNFNQFTWIAGKPGHYANDSDGSVTCCLPWYADLSSAQAGWPQQQCNVAACACSSLQALTSVPKPPVNSENQIIWSSYYNIGNEAGSGHGYVPPATVQQPWVGQCRSVTSATVSNSSMYQTSLGCPFPLLAESLEKCQAYGQQELQKNQAAQQAMTIPQSCVAQQQCLPNSTCQSSQGGTGLQACSSCSMMGCFGSMSAIPIPTPQNLESRWQSGFVVQVSSNCSCYTSQDQCYYLPSAGSLSATDYLGNSCGSPG